MKRMTLIFASLFLISFTFFSCKEDRPKGWQIRRNPNNNHLNKPELSNEQKAQKILDRARILLPSLPEVKDIYGLKKIFNNVLITTCTYHNKIWDFSVEGEPFIIFVVPSQTDFDKGCPKNAIMVTKSGKMGNAEFPFVVINPKWLQTSNQIDIDYLSTCMLHEAVHCWRFMGIISGKLKPIPAIEREREAYLYQFEFVPIIIKNNNLDIKISKKIKIKSHHDMITLATQIDVENEKKLGMFANLVVEKNYFEQCLPFLVLEEK